MIRYLLDANVIVHWLSRHHPEVTRRTAFHRHDSAVSAVALHELYFGALAGNRQRETIALYRAAGLPILPFEDADALAAGEVRATLRRRGTPIGPYDALIAGQALARDLILVTNNTGEFARVDGLKLADWTLA